jgi:hypothetical protein
MVKVPFQVEVGRSFGCLQRRLTPGPGTPQRQPRYWARPRASINCRPPGFQLHSAAACSSSIIHHRLPVILLQATPRRDGNSGISVQFHHLLGTDGFQIPKTSTTKIPR